MLILFLCALVLHIWPVMPLADASHIQHVSVTMNAEFTQALPRGGTGGTDFSLCGPGLIDSEWHRLQSMWSWLN